MISNTVTGVVEGTWEEIASHALEFNGHRLRVIILPDEPRTTPEKLISKGMLPQLAWVTDEDFEASQFHTDPDGGAPPLKPIW